MMPTAIEASWTFVRSPTYTAISIGVGLVVVLFLAALTIQQELLQASRTGDSPLPRPRGRLVMPPLLLCFAVIVALRLSDLAYQRPGTISTGTTSVAARPTPSTTPPASPTTHSAVAATPTSSRFYFAGGPSGPNERAYLSLGNPTSQAVGVHLTFFFGAAGSTTRTLNVPANSRQEIPISSLEPFNGSFGLRVVANQPIAANLRLSRTGHDDDILTGNTSLGTTWYLAEGYTSLTFHESVAILNPDPQWTVHVILHLRPQGHAAERDLSEAVAPHSQLVVDINRLAPAETLGMVITSDLPTCVTRILTFGKNASGLTTQAGLANPARNWTFAEAATTDQRQTFLLMLNPGPHAVQVMTRFYGPTGKVLGAKRLVVDPAKRETVRLNDLLSAPRFSTVINSDEPIVVEQAKYSGASNNPLGAGSVVPSR